MMEKFICKHPKGLRFSDKGKDFSLKNGEVFEAEKTPYFDYLLKSKFIEVVKPEIVTEADILPVVDPVIEPAPAFEPVIEPVVEPAKNEAEPAKTDADPAEAESTPEKPKKSKKNN